MVQTVPPGLGFIGQSGPGKRGYGRAHRAVAARVYKISGKIKRGKKGGGIRSGSDIFMVLEAENEKFYNGEDYYKGY